MLSEHDIKKAKDVLELAIKKKSEVCDSWKDSGDRGACHHYEVWPLKRVVEFFDSYLEDLKSH